MPVVLGSRSPRRRELLEPVVGKDQLLVCPPGDSEELGFHDLHNSEAIHLRLRQIVQTKMDDVTRQVRNDCPADTVCCVTADTIVVARDPQSGIVVLGQPDEDSWQEQVRDWMLRLYSGTTHEVWTGWQVANHEHSLDGIVCTKVQFCEITPRMVDWYVTTGESIGKAGGYAIQGAAAAFVDAIDGSLTNIIGLPVLEVTRALQSFYGDIPVVPGAD
jgi:septum formation protein